MMDSAAVLDLLKGLERRYPVDLWTVDGLHVWPLLRVRYYTLLVHHFLGTGARGAGQPSRLGRIANSFGALGRIAYNQLVDFRKSARPRKEVEAVFLSDGVSLTELDGEWYDRFMDPVIAALCGQGRHSLLMMPMNKAAVPRRTPSLYVQPRLDAAKAMSTVEAKLRSFPAHELDGVEEISRELFEAAGGLSLPGRQWVAQQAGRVQRMARVFERLVRGTRARAAFVNTYYSAEGMAFILAARRCGCVAIDVQHGSQNLHVAYGGWMRAPEQGYELLPDLFWCWSDEETRIINEGPGSHPAHKAVAVGNPWVQSWSDPGNPAAEALRRRVATLVAASGARYHFLVTPGVGFPDEDVKLLADAMAAGQQDIHWWLRWHPTQRAERQVIIEQLAAAGVRNVEIEAATVLPLPILLDAMDANITQASSTVIEAREAGVPSVITTTYGAGLFPVDVRSGSSAVAMTADSIVAAARRLADSKPLRRRDSRVDSRRLHEALADLYEGRSSTGNPDRAEVGGETN